MKAHMYTPPSKITPMKQNKPKFAVIILICLSNFPKPPLNKQQKQEQTNNERVIRKR